MDASRLLLEQMLTRGSNSQSLIFPAMFNFRHGIEVALKWHIRYAGGTIPQHAGHDLEILIEAFGRTAEGLDENVTYISGYMLDLVSELATLDPRSIAFRYPTEIDGSEIPISNLSWDLRRLLFTVDYLSILFDNLSGWIDMSTEEYQAMLHKLDNEQRV
ncbi:MAG: hypothetical protein JWL96_2698 [Sphingomonas bacterium]|uniref:hypothetical protein n=1 Tax=Sphingomonas bacterium TaxID=1895847 RepID=UPI00261D54AD|nr:hypothetical protein [Sphingomonas bacterium]MDB5710628.1 hypothetical protein [Sphingomonas bacterium]